MPAIVEGQDLIKLIITNQTCRHIANIQINVEWKKYFVGTIYLILLRLRNYLSGTQ